TSADVVGAAAFAAGAGAAGERGAAAVVDGAAALAQLLTRLGLAALVGVEAAARGERDGEEEGQTSHARHTSGGAIVEAANRLAVRAAKCATALRARRRRSRRPWDARYRRRRDRACWSRSLCPPPTSGCCCCWRPD